MYCIEQDLIDRFGEEELIQITDLDHTQMIGQTILNQAIADAESEINSYLRLRYALPLLVIPPELVSVACDITRYRLMRDGASDAVTKRYELAVSFLKNLSIGRAVLPKEVNDTTTTSVHVSLPKVTAVTPFFTESLLAKM